MNEEKSEVKLAVAEDLFNGKPLIGFQHTCPNRATICTDGKKSYRVWQGSNNLSLRNYPYHSGDLIKRTGDGVRNNEIKSVLWNSTLTEEGLMQYLRDVFTSRNEFVAPR